MVVNELSAKLRCLKNLHFVTGSVTEHSRLEELPERCWTPEWELEFELPDSERLILVELPRGYLKELSCLELVGRVGEVLLFRGLCLKESLSASSY